MRNRSDFFSSNPITQILLYIVFTLMWFLASRSYLFFKRKTNDGYVYKTYTLYRFVLFDLICFLPYGSHVGF